MSGHDQAHASNDEPIVGVTRDPILRPIGALMVVVGAIWAVFWGMAAQAGSFGQPLAAAGLIALGLLAASTGKSTEQS
jgi:hypothetical protein